MCHQDPATPAKAGVLELSIYSLSFRLVKNSQILRLNSALLLDASSPVYVPAHSALNCVDSPGECVLDTWQLKANLDGQKLFADGYNAGTP